MAPGTAPQEVVVESDFLLGLRYKDARHASVERVRAVLYSRGLRSEEVEEAFALMDAILASHGMEGTAPVKLADVVVADRMRSREPGLGFFDSLHVAVSKRLGKAILSSGGTYERVGLPVLNLDKY